MKLFKPLSLLHRIKQCWDVQKEADNVTPINNEQERGGGGGNQ